MDVRVFDDSQASLILMQQSIKEVGLATSALLICIDLSGYLNNVRVVIIILCFFLRCTAGRI